MATTSCFLSFSQVKGADMKVLESYCRFVVTAGKAMELNISGRYV